MEEKQPSVFKNALYYGLLTGAGMIVYSLVLYLLNMQFNQSLGYISYLILAGGLVWGTIDYRKKTGGFLTYGKAFSSCFQVGLVAAVLVCIYMYLYVTLINPGFLDELMTLAREQQLQRAPEMSEEQLDQAMGFAKNFMSPPFFAIWGFVVQLFFTVILSLIIAIFLKKEDKSMSAPV